MLICVGQLQRRQHQTQIPDSAFDLPASSTTPPTTTTITSEPALPLPGVGGSQDEDLPDPWYESPSSITSKGGLKSRKAMHDEYQIVSRNDMDRRRGARQGGFITRGMLAMLAQHMRAQQGGAEGEDGEEEIDPEGCGVM